MILSKRVSLNNIWLDELSNRIVITGIEEAAGKDTLNTTAAAGWMGTRITQQRRDTLDVTVRFRILAEKRMMQTRETILEKVNEWASTNSGGWLRVGHKENRRLQVVLVQTAAMGDPWNWTNEYTIVFRAFSVPYWEFDGAVPQWSYNVSASGTGSISIGGNAPTQLSVIVTNKSGKTINSVSITIGSKTIAFTGLGLLANQQLIIGYTRSAEVCVPFFRIGSTSVMAARTPTSADEFDMTPGTKTVRWTAERAVQVQIAFTERYL